LRKDGFEESGKEQLKERSERGSSFQREDFLAETPLNLGSPEKGYIKKTTD